MKGLSDKEMEIVSDLEFSKKYFFTKDDIKSHFKTYNQIRHTIHKLIQKERIIKLNKSKYYLVPIKAKTGKWTEDSFILIDEIMNGKDYFIGGWAAANYYKLTDQIAMKIEVYTTKRQGRYRILTTTIIFRRTTKNRIKKAIDKQTYNPNFKIMNIEEMKKWIKLRT